MNAIYIKLIEGGPVFMFPILFLLILILVLIVKGDYIIAIAAGILNISGIQLYRWVEDHDNNE